ncbi:beta-N-acetylglucosaminidase domain-containing protein [Streptomyces liangshanensis]|uniref:Hyaluronidase n=1 Tax=Streptomyces liangshanensis TaxID=2717324 RepID=A0A6G9H3B9_9ACTN|nr:beta-N-acetylglucosaminidase domain-containing protein [Streptomyces liangshanensis]QIQ04796.1 hyaluronidase [Streptomyces liangshanensis]
MRLGRTGRTATAVAVAVIGGLLGGAPGAYAAPGDKGAPVAATPAHAGRAAVPDVWPRPQTIEAAGRAVPLGDLVTVVVGEDADPVAVQALTDLLRTAGVRTVGQAAATDPLGAGTVVLAGGTRAREALRALRAGDGAGLPSGGYRLAVGKVAGRDTIALDGVGEDGLFHGAQTLRQLIVKPRNVKPRNVKPGAKAGAGATVPGVVVRDWPGTLVRGTTEGFYGEPWTPRERLAQIDFMGRTKQNRFLYAPGDDPFRQARWRDPYPAAERAAFRELAERAARNHVTLAWAVAPAQSMCMTSGDDLRALNRKIDAMWALGVRAFQLQFQDVSYSEWHCDADADTFGSGPEAAARAQARVANAVAEHLAERHPDSEPLTVMPTEYHQDGVTAYRTALAGTLDGGVHVAWTGVGVVPRTITGRELAGAKAAFAHPMVTMDNYPVNDYEPGRIFLGPYTGREPAVAGGSVALLANAMEQASASRVPLFTAADYAWNPRGYVPAESWRAAVDDLAGEDTAAREALRALAGNDASSLLDRSESAYLKPLFTAFWASRATSDARARSEAAARLRAAFTVMAGAPERLSATAGGRLDDEVRPWLDQLARYGQAGELAVDTLTAQDRGDGAAAWRASLALEPLRGKLRASEAVVGEGTLGPFLDRAVKAAAGWTGADRDTGGDVARDAGSYTVRLDRARPVTAVTAMTEPGTGAGARVEVRVPGAGWRPLGALSTSGWTQADAQGVLADAVRIVWPAAGAASGVLGPGAPAPAVRKVVPWFADEPGARLDLAPREADAQIGGKPERVEARLEGRRPGEVRGSLTAKAPSGIRVTAPKETTVPRGADTTVPLEVRVKAGTPAGSYEVPVAFGDERSTLTVRASPRTAGPDLARGAAASSSGDETPDFPASAAVDGDPATRWSSPVEDGAWWQVELPGAARVGQVVLTWQEAYASRYRVQVSADGRTWRTAATVTDGRGGREAIGMDAKDTRFVRVQGDTRATKYGYSLFSAEVYAVAP